MRRGNLQAQRCGSDCERGRLAHCASHGIADHYFELRAIVGACRSRCGVGGICRPGNSCAVLLPLVSKWRSPVGGHCKSRRMPDSHGLACRLCSDRGSRGSGIYGKLGGIARHASSSVADHHFEYGAIIGARRSRRTVTGRSSSRNRNPVLLPLVTQWGCARGDHRKPGGLPHGHGLVCWLSNDRWNRRGGVATVCGKPDDSCTASRHHENRKDQRQSASTLQVSYVTRFQGIPPANGSPARAERWATT